MSLIILLDSNVSLIIETLRYICVTKQTQRRSASRNGLATLSHTVMSPASYLRRCPFIRSKGSRLA